MTLSHADYARLLALRTGLRRFERWSEQQARAAGLTSAQHQLLLAIAGHDDSRGPTIGEVADYLYLRHHSAVELINRADVAGLVERRGDPDDLRLVRLRLTRAGATSLEKLSSLHLAEIERLELRLPDAGAGLALVRRAHGFAEKPSDGQPRVEIARVYDKSATTSGPGVLVDRLWPRGLARADAPFDVWMKDVAPSTELRIYYGHRPKRFATFSRRYRQELRSTPASTASEQLRHLARNGGVTLLTATKDLEHSSAAVLGDVLMGT